MVTPRPWTDPAALSATAGKNTAVKIGEQLGGTNQGTYTTDAVKCTKTGDTNTVVPVTSGGFTMPNYPVTCTYTNRNATNTAAVGEEVGRERGHGRHGRPAGRQQPPRPRCPTSNAPTPAPGPPRPVAAPQVTRRSVRLGGRQPGLLQRRPLECTKTGDPNTVVPVSADGGFTMPNYPVTCTYTNERTSNTLQLEKAVGRERGHRRHDRPAGRQRPTKGRRPTAPAPGPTRTPSSPLPGSGPAVTVRWAARRQHRAPTPPTR